MTIEQYFEKVSAAAGRQHGLVTAAQVRRLAGDGTWLDALVGRGRLVELDWQVFEIADNPTPPRYAYPYAAWLALRPADFAWERPGAGGDLTADAVLSHESAARALGLGSPSVGTVSFIAPTALPAPRAVRVLVVALKDEEVALHQGIPVTTPHRTIVDLVRDHVDHVELRHVLTDAVRLDLVDLAAIHRDLSPFAAAQGFPVAGPEFLGWFLPHLNFDALSARNSRAAAELLRPAESAEPDGLPRSHEETDPASADVDRDLKPGQDNGETSRWLT